MSQQLGLFPTGTPGPQGLRYQPDFVSIATQGELIAQISALPLAPFQFGAFQGKRRVASFGWRYDYTRQQLEPAQDLPEWLKPLIAAIEASEGLLPKTVRQVLCTEYEPGAGIGWHRDKPHFDKVVGLSLGSACQFRFRRRRGAKWERYTLEAKARSLYLMTGEARHVWEHSIPQVEAPRYSITFRTMVGEAAGRPGIQRHE